MPVQNVLIAALLDEIADRLEIQGENLFRVRAYRGAARTVQNLPDDVKQMVERGETLAGWSGIRQRHLGVESRHLTSVTGISAS